MKIAVTTFGSEGDARPYIALAVGLLRAGHEAWVVAPEAHRERALQVGVPFRGGTPTFLDAVYREIADVIAERSPLRQSRMIFDALAPELVRGAKKVVEAVADADVVVHHHIDASGFAAAALLNKPRIAGHLMASATPLSQHLVDGGNLGRWTNRAASSLLRSFMAKTAQRAFDDVFREVGLPSRKRAFLESGESPLLNLLAFSPLVFPTDALWVAPWLQTGYWFLDVPQYEPPAKLGAFLEAGEPPIVVSFGSMVSSRPEVDTREVFTALAQVGRRALVQTGLGGLGRGGIEVPGSIQVIDHVPHDWLFPRAACVVHHGGAGTTAAVLRAGVPQVVVWHLGDQPLWGKIVERSGVAGPTIPHHKLRARRLARSLELALRPEKAARAKALGESIRSENGVRRAVEAIERVVAKG